jgi:hypothetical protein
VSLGATAESPNKNIISIGAGLPGELMYGMLVEQDINCRTIGRCVYGAHLDREILDLVRRPVGPGKTMEEQYAVPPIPLTTDLGRHFLYARYNADLSKSGLASLGFGQLNPDHIQKLDATENIPDLLAIGREAAQHQVRLEHFGDFV